MTPRVARAALLVAPTILAGTLVLACDGSTGPVAMHGLALQITGWGDGRVTSDPAGIDCRSAATDGCAAEFEEGTTVVLTATPDAGSELVAWSGAGSGEAARTVTIGGPQAVTAEFRNPDRTGAMIGPEGGEVVSTDGAMTLAIPAGAVGATTAITIELIDADALGAAWDGIRGVTELEGTYEMGPAGLTFDGPITVTIPLGRSVTQDADTLAIVGGYLLTLQGDSAIGLDSVSIQPDAEMGAMMLSAQLTHFSPLVQVTGSGWEFSVRGVPDRAYVGEEFLVSIYAGALLGIYTPRAIHAVPVYGDFSDAPVVGPKETVLLERLDNYDWTGSALYTCLEEGEGVYRGKMFWVSESHQGPVHLESRQPYVTFEKPVVCEPGPEPVFHDLQIIVVGVDLYPGADRDPVNVTSEPEGIDCTGKTDGTSEGTCTAAFEEGAEVTLRSSGADWVRTGVSGATSTNTEGDPVVAMDGERAVELMFEPSSWSLGITPIGDGDGAVTSEPTGIECTKTGQTVDGTCNGAFATGTTVTLTAAAADGSELIGWSGACSGTAASADITMTADGTCDVEFGTLVTHDLTIQLSGAGTGGVVVTPGELECTKVDETPSECTFAIAEGTTVSITPTAGENSAVGDITGCDEVVDLICQLTMTGPRTAGFAYGSTEATLQVTLEGGGSVALSPQGDGEDCGGGAIIVLCRDYAVPVTVTMTPQPDAGWYFQGWTGDPCEGLVSSCVVTLDDPREWSFTATFVESALGEFFLPLMDGAEAVSPVDARFPVTRPTTSGDPASAPVGLALAAAPVSPDCPLLAAAGTDGGVIVESCTGDILQTYTATGRTNYDMVALPRPDGQAAGLHGLLQSGQGFFLCPYDDRGQQDGFCQNGLETDYYPDIALIGGDAARGAILVNNTQRRVEITRYSSESGSWYVDSEFVPTDYTPFDVQTAVTNAEGTKLLVIGDGDVAASIYFVDAAAQPMTARGGQISLGARRIRCDLASTLCAVSIYGNSQSARRVTLLRWDGQTEPFGQAWNSARVADGLAEGAIGLDVLGNRVVTAGYNDNQYSIITVDIESPGLSYTIQTAPLPEGCTQPGHAIFLRDNRNSIAISCNGSGGMAVIPDAFVP